MLIVQALLSTLFSVCSANVDASVLMICWACLEITTEAKLVSSSCVAVGLSPSVASVLCFFLPQWEKEKRATHAGGELQGAEVEVKIVLIGIEGVADAGVSKLSTWMAASPACTSCKTSARRMS